MRKPSSTTVVVKSVDRELVRRAMDAYAERLFSVHPEIEEIVVFGSFETGNYAPGSDLDVLILLLTSPLSVRDRIPRFLPERFPVPVDIFPYTLAEVEVRQESPVLKAARLSQWRYHRAETVGE